jgi:hypothetical protein
LGRSRAQRFAALDRAHGIDAATQMTSYRYFISSLDAPAVRQLQGIAEPTIQQFRQRASSGRRRRDELSVNHGPTTGALRACLDAAFDSNGTLAAVSAYAEAPMRVTGLALELSVADSPWWAHAMPGHEPPSTLYAHVDETISCPKAIVYLSDVATGQGETSFYPAAYEALGLGAAQQLIGRVVSNVGNDHNSGLASFYKKPYHQSTASPDFRRHFMRLPAALRFNSHLGWDVQAGSRLETELASREKTMLGPAGTFVAFDGSQLLHRGGMVRSGERIALQVMFGPDDWRRRAARLARRVRW